MDSNSLYKNLYNKAVQLLAQRNHSSAELRQKLINFYLKSLSASDKDEVILPCAEIDAVIQYCLLHHWLDDSDYINQYIDVRVRKGYGRNRIIMELKQKGLANALILDIISQKDKNIDWHELAIIQINKKFPAINKQDIQQKAKIFQFLMQKGFRQEDIRLAYSLLK